MTKEQMAEMINGRSRGDELSTAEEQMAKANGLLVVFTYSDDCMEFRGIINDELECYEGGTAVLLDKKHSRELPELISKEVFEDLKEIMEAKGMDFNPKTVEITATWAGNADPCFTISTTIPHATFMIFDEDNLQYCQGIVIDINDLAVAMA